MTDQSTWLPVTNAAYHAGHPLTATVEAPDVEDDVWIRYVRGELQSQIGQALDQSKSWANLTIDRQLEVRGKSQPHLLLGHVEKLLDEVCLVRQAAWSGWDQSQTEKVRKVEKTKAAGPRGGGGCESSITSETRVGEASFLRLLLDCNKRESTLRGIEKPLATVVEFKPPQMDLKAMIRQAEAAFAEGAAKGA